MFVGKVTWDSGSKVPIVMLRYRRHGAARDDLPPMPGKVAQLLARCFRIDPKERPASMDEIADETQAALDEAAPRPAEGVAGN